MAWSIASSSARLKAGSPGPDWSSSQFFALCPVTNRTRMRVHHAQRVLSLGFPFYAASGPGPHRQLHANARAQPGDLAIRAIGLAGVTAAPPVPDQPMAEHGPLVLRHEFHQFRLD